MDYYKYLTKKVGKIIEGNDCEWILYPFGLRGMMVKAILNTMYGIKEKAIIDNVLCDTHPYIESLEYLESINWNECKVFITSDNEEIYEELRRRLYSVVDKKHCIELFEIPEWIEEKWQRSKVIEKMKREEIAPIYHPRKTKSKFFLPLLPIDLIQRIILLTDDYCDRKNLDYIFKEFNDGIIGKKVSEGNGVVCDIGANIGNHTLYFCNEYNARKVYTFEPIELTYSILAENIKINHLENRVLLNEFALGDNDCHAQMGGGYNLVNIGATSLKEDKNGNFKIRTLDGMGIDELVIFIKIDVEGMELKVIKGGLELIKKNRPYMMIESVEDGPFPAMLKILQEIGYEYERLGRMDWLFYPV